MRRWIVERLFERELDEDFYLGVKEGQRRMQYHLLNNIKQVKETAPKSKHTGLDAAIKIIEDIRW
jgi:hypothetical protein